MSPTTNCNHETLTPGGRCENCEREPVGRIICQTSEALQDLFAQTGDDVPEAASPLLPDPPSIIKALECLRQCMFPGRWLPQA